MSRRAIDAEFFRICPVSLEASSTTHVPGNSYNLCCPDYMWPWRNRGHHTGKSAKMLFFVSANRNESMVDFILMISAFLFFCLLWDGFYFIFRKMTVRNKRSLPIELHKVAFLVFCIVESCSPSLCAIFQKLANIPCLMNTWRKHSPM